ncbi:hypothetical protein HHK36_031892 [Tetracentron sinense]|uniref:DUF659 domain-containing protein n=1 Tax=Tetracentron sinense TaxID=13715 RepID=A0A834Y897_TETSI|nr:hypothetical protein HHK36_031892 [Tetracentron sinense]
MVESIGKLGLGVKAPSYHEARVSLLKKEVAYTNELLQHIRELWGISGCSIMSDCWTDRRNRSLINFLMNSPGTLFLESVDASSYAKTRETLFELLDSYVEKVGEQNVWLTGNMQEKLVHEEDDFTCDQVAEASVANERRVRPTRSRLQSLHRGVDDEPLSNETKSDGEEQYIEEADNNDSYGVMMRWRMKLY